MRTYGIERERFIANAEGRIIPAIGTLLPVVQQMAQGSNLSPLFFSHELFAGQIEDRTPACKTLDTLQTALEENDAVMKRAATKLGVAYDYSEMLDARRITSFEVNPFDQRHQAIWETLPHERKVAASVVAAVHVHVSCSKQEAVSVLRFCRTPVVELLVKLGDHSGGRRIEAYRAMAETHGTPPLFTNIDELMNYITSHGGEKNVWDLVRYKPSTGTVEFRMFGTTSSIPEVLSYVQACINVVQCSI